MTQRFYTGILQKLYGAVKHIFPPFVAVLYLGLPVQKAQQPVLLITGFFLAAACMAGYAYFVNDIGDVETDRVSGKKNLAQSLRPALRLLIALALLLPGLVIFRLAVPSVIAFWLLVVQAALLTLYALPPVRAKNNPVLGPLVDAHYGHVVPVFIAVFSFFFFNPEFYWVNFPLIYVWLLTKGLRNILLHQLDDRKKDKQAGLRTFPNRFGPVATLHFINRVLLPLELVWIGLNLFWFWPASQTIAIAMGAFLVFYFFNFSGWRLFTIPYRQLKFKFLYFLNDFYEYWLPYACIWSCRLELEYKIVLTLIHALVFYQGGLKLLKDLRKIGENLHIVNGQS